jgi:catechol 2,3-dioxygenase-like lactoylglutathione lyase family enzyme
MIKFNSPLIVVEDMARARHFYEDLLEQKVKFDFGENVVFEGDFSIHLQPHFQSLLGPADRFPVTHPSHWGEMYFDGDHLDQLAGRLADAGVEFIHPVVEQPWGQRVMRFYDPDHHIVEIGETFEAISVRMHAAGASVDEICEKISMTREFVEKAITEC